MPACGQCGKENPEGTVFCGYCANPLKKPAANVAPQPAKPAGNPAPSPARGPAAQAKLSKPEIRTPIIHTSTPPPSGGGQRKGGFELIPWSELSPVQRAGRSAAALVVLLLIFFSIRGMLRSFTGSGASDTAPSAPSSNLPISDGDRKDGIESLCKIFQIYGLPTTDHDATEAARNAGESFKLAGNQSPERSEYILTTIVREFRSGKLGANDCAEAGSPLPTTEQSPDNSAPDIQR